MPSKYQTVNDWTTKKVKLLKYWQEECRLYNWLYNQNVQYYQQVNRNLSIVSVLLSAVTGATLLNNTDPPNPGLILAFGVVSIISSFIQGLRQFLDLDNKISANTFISRQNSAIVIDIEEQLNLAREERINGTEFIKSIKTRKNEIIQSAPLISKSRWSQLKKKIKAGEGISFFNESVFKSYLETTVNMGDLKLDTPEDEEDPPSTPRDGLTHEYTVDTGILSQGPGTCVPLNLRPPNPFCKSDVNTSLEVALEFNVNDTISPDKLEAITIGQNSSPNEFINCSSTVDTGILSHASGTGVPQNSRPFCARLLDGSGQQEKNRRLDLRGDSIPVTRVANNADINTAGSIFSRYSTPENVIHIPPDSPVFRRSSSISLPELSRRDMSTTLPGHDEVSSRRDMSTTLPGHDEVSSRRDMSTTLPGHDEVSSRRDMSTTLPGHDEVSSQNNILSLTPKLPSWNLPSSAILQNSRPANSLNAMWNTSRDVSLELSETPVPRNSARSQVSTVNASGTAIPRNSNPPFFSSESSQKEEFELSVDGTGSEDELINELQGDNLCVQQLRHSLYTEPKNSHSTKGPKKHKLTEVLKYHMGRL